MNVNFVLCKQNYTDLIASIQVKPSFTVTFILCVTNGTKPLFLETNNILNYKLAMNELKHKHCLVCLFFSLVFILYRFIFHMQIWEIWRAPCWPNGLHHFVCSAFLFFITNNMQSKSETFVHACFSACFLKDKAHLHFVAVVFSCGSIFTAFFKTGCVPVYYTQWVRIGLFTLLG